MSYSQNNEEEIILAYFDHKPISYLDCGANDGITLSNTYELYRMKCEGVCVEASPKAFERLKENQPRSILINAALGTYDGEIVLNESGCLLGKDDIALVSSTREDEMYRWVSLKMEFSPIVVRCITFDTMLKECGVNHFDFLSLDIEGCELDILPQIKFDELGIRLACIEFNGKDKHKYDEIMLPFGYRLIHQNPENLIYAV